MSGCFRRGTSFRWYSGYLRDPFHIGYPQGSSREAIGQIRSAVFCNEKLLPFDVFMAEGNSSDKWQSLNLYEKSKYESRALRSEYKYTRQKPEKVSGFKLFFLLNNHIKSKPTADKQWRRLSTESRDIYSTDAEFIEKAHRELVRVWEGWEIVEYLKEGKYSSDSASTFNPFPYLGLYPWEIITSKLILTKKYLELFEFEVDYFDRLIYEAFSGKLRSVEAMYRDTAEASRGVDLSSTMRAHLETNRSKRSKHMESNRPVSKTTLPFILYVKQLNKDDQYASLSYKQLVSKAAESWRKLTPEEKQVYKPEISSNSIEYSYDQLQQKVAIVMRYIYEVGGVEGVGSDYNWREDMQSKEQWKQLT